MYRVFCRNTFPYNLPNVLGFKTSLCRIRLKDKDRRLGTVLAVIVIKQSEDSMLSIRVENLNDLAIIECRGRIVRSESVFKLRDVVQEQTDARIIALDLSAVQAIGGGAWECLRFSIAGQTTTIFSSSCSVPPHQWWTDWCTTAPS